MKTLVLELALEVEHGLGSRRRRQGIVRGKKSRIEADGGRGKNDTKVYLHFQSLRKFCWLFLLCSMSDNSHVLAAPHCDLHLNFYSDLTLFFQFPLCLLKAFSVPRTLSVSSDTCIRCCCSSAQSLPGAAQLGIKSRPLMFPTGSVCSHISAASFPSIPSPSPSSRLLFSGTSGIHASGHLHVFFLRIFPGLAPSFHSGLCQMSPIQKRHP